jgi:hypothetical protein
MRDAGTAYIPSTLTPEDARLTPEDARLTPEDALANGAGAWPGDLLTFNDSWATRAFELYWNLWYEGSSGALQTGQGFLSAGMELGSPLLALRKRKYPDQILEWHAQHTTLKGAHTWATLLPAPSKAGGGVPLGGLAPSLRADAAYVTLMRNLFVMENGGYLFLFPGITLRWFEMEEELGVINAPTRYGSLSVRITTEGQKKTVIDFFDTTANPPKGYMLNQIIPSTSPQIRVDGQPYSHSKTDFLLILPAHAKRIEINW